MTSLDLRTVNDLPRGAARWVTDVIGRGSRIAWARRLRLGGWHVNHALDVVDADGRTHRLVLRRWARPDWEAEDPDHTVERETWVLELLHSTQVPAPTVVAADPSGVRCDVPAMLLTRLAGHPSGAGGANRHLTDETPTRRDWHRP